MSQTVPDISVSGDWVNVNTATGIAVGAAILITNKSGITSAGAWVILAEGAHPDAKSTSGTIIGDVNSQYAQATVPSGSLAIWAKCTVPTRSVSLSVQAL